MFLLPQGADLPSEALALDHLLGGELAEVRAAEFKGKLGEVAVVRGAGRLREDAVALLGLGAADQLDGVRLRAAIQIGLRALAARGVLTPSLRWTGEPAPGLGQTAVGAAALEASVLARWSEATRRTGQPPKLHAALHLEGFDGLDAATAAEAAVLGEATNLARELVNAPANELTPAELARCAAEVAGESGLECEVLGDRELRKLGYGAILAVAAASQFPAQMVV
ncbi:MAG TPA: M17 family peptidase N-terminal domain-containing protein, partial [Candidatus Dormibacteraeota bacterium]|nr:M17 family peptidase N-terminal domain-containing protein [Candidatus Dormibacteraeota bacterium]